MVNEYRLINIWSRCSRTVRKTHPMSLSHCCAAVAVWCLWTDNRCIKVLFGLSAASDTANHCESLSLAFQCFVSYPQDRIVPVWITNFLFCTNFLWSTTGIHFRPDFILYFRHIPFDSFPRCLLDQMHRVGCISEVQILSGSVSEVGLCLSANTFQYG